MKASARAPWQEVEADGSAEGTLVEGGVKCLLEQVHGTLSEGTMQRPQHRLHTSTAAKGTGGPRALFEATRSHPADPTGLYRLWAWGGGWLGESWPACCPGKWPSGFGCCPAFLWVFQAA